MANDKQTPADLLHEINKVKPYDSMGLDVSQKEMDAEVRELEEANPEAARKLDWAEGLVPSGEVEEAVSTGGGFPWAIVLGVVVVVVYVMFTGGK